MKVRAMLADGSKYNIKYRYATIAIRSNVYNIANDTSANNKFHCMIRNNNQEKSIMKG